MPVTITEAALRRLKPTADGRRVTISDSTVRGYVAAAQPSGRVSLYAQATMKGSGGRVLRRLVGHWPEMSAEEGRRRASEYLRQIRYDGRDPSAVARDEALLRRTWAEAMDAHIRAKAKSPATRRFYEGAVRDRHLAAWKAKPLHEIGAARSEWLRSFERIKEESGEPSAALTMTIARAAYRRAMRLDPSLPREPWAAIDWPKPRARRTALLEGDNLARFCVSLSAEDPSKRDLLLLCLLAGTRITEASEARREHARPERSILHIPAPKGHTNGKPPFDAPLNSYARLVVERSLARSNNGLLFPSARLGHAFYEDAGYGGRAVLSALERASEHLAAPPPRRPR
jgi:integrase